VLVSPLKEDCSFEVLVKEKGITLMDLLKPTIVSIDSTYIHQRPGVGRLVKVGSTVDLKDPNSSLREFLGPGPYVISWIGQWRCGRVSLYFSGPGAHADDFKFVRDPAEVSPASQAEIPTEYVTASGELIELGIICCDPVALDLVKKLRAVARSTTSWQKFEEHTKHEVFQFARASSAVWTQNPIHRLHLDLAIQMRVLRNSTMGNVSESFLCFIGST
jgi:hypothetical protein